VRFERDQWELMRSAACVVWAMHRAQDVNRLHRLQPANLARASSKFRCRPPVFAACDAKLA